MQRAVNVVGFKKSGKTALTVALAEELTRLGHKPAGAKLTHQPRADKADVDSGRLLETCTAVALSAGAESAVFWSKRRGLIDLLPFLEGDVLVVEGGKELTWLPRILVLRAPEEAADLSPDLALCAFGEVAAPGLPQARDLGELARLVLERGFVLAGLDCGACGRPDCRALAVDILAGRAKPEDCRTQGAALSVRINGRPLGMNPFVEKVVGSTIRGLLREMKGYAPGRIDIELEG